MKFLGIDLEIKKVPKRDNSEDVRLLFQMVQELEKRIDTTFKAQDSLRKRFERAKIQSNGSEDPEPQLFADQGSDPGPGSYKTGDPWRG